MTSRAMHADEGLALQTWILTGNAVNIVLRSLPNSQADLRAKVDALAERLRDVPAERILAEIATLSAEDRDLLIAICEKCLGIAGDESETRLGVRADEAALVLSRLRMT
jgi:hypothetical protein